MWCLSKVIVYYFQIFGLTRIAYNIKYSIFTIKVIWQFNFGIFCEFIPITYKRLSVPLFSHSLLVLKCRNLKLLISNDFLSIAWHKFSLKQSMYSSELVYFVVARSSGMRTMKLIVWKNCSSAQDSLNVSQIHDLHFNSFSLILIYVYLSSSITTFFYLVFDVSSSWAIRKYFVA